MDREQIYESVQEHYSFAARNAGGQYGQKVAEAFGYTSDELETIPKDANLGLCCGNPLALAKLKEVRCCSSFCAQPSSVGTCERWLTICAGRDSG